MEANELKVLLGVNERNLSYEFSHLPGCIGEYNTLLAEAQDAELHAKMHFEVTEARVDGEVRALLPSLLEPGKKYTEGMVEKGVLLHADVQTARRQYIAAVTARNKIKAVCEGLEAKRAMLMSLGAFQRSEMGEMTMRERAMKNGDVGR